MTMTTSWVLVPVLLAASSVACGGGGGTTSSTTDTQLTAARGPDGVTTTYHAGALPAPQGALTITVAAPGTAINGGSALVSVAGVGRAREGPRRDRRRQRLLGDRGPPRERRSPTSC